MKSLAHVMGSLVFLAAACADPEGSDGLDGPQGPPGEPGAQGEPGPVGPGPIVAVNAGLVGNGTAEAPLAVSFGGTGSATTVARSDHEHDARYLRLGSTLACSGTEKMSGLAASGDVICQPDHDTQYAAGSGLSSTGTTLSVAPRGITPEHLQGHAVLHRRLFTPRWLEANAAFPSSRAVSFSDLAVSVAAGTSEWDKLIEVPLLPAHALAAGESYLVRIGVDHSPPGGAENDPVFGVSDGDHFVGFMKGDSLNTELGWIATGTDGATTLGDAAYSGVGGPGGNAHHFEVVLQLTPAANNTMRVMLLVHSGTNEGHGTTTAAWLTSQPLYFVVFANNAVEAYTFRAFEVTVEREG